jgi:hypothetical protein
MNPEELLMSYLGEVLREAGGGGEQQPKKYPYHPRRGLLQEPTGCFAKGQAEKFDYYAYQGEVSGHADHGAYQGVVTYSRQSWHIIKKRRSVSNLFVI